MKTFKIITLIFIPFFVNAQKMTLVEILNTTKSKNFDCFESFVSKKKFCFEETVNDERLGDLYRFSTCDFIKDGPTGIDTKNQASFRIGNNSSYVITDFGTSSSKTYLGLKTELVTLGFKSVKTDNSNSDRVAVQYKSTKYPKINLIVFTNKVSKEGVGNWTYWDFSVKYE